jgi:hypothetical protein
MKRKLYFVFIFISLTTSVFSRSKQKNKSWNNWLTPGINYTMLFTGQENNNENYLGGGFEFQLLNGRDPGTNHKFFSFYKIYFKIGAVSPIIADELPLSIYSLGFSSGFNSEIKRNHLIPYSGCEIGITQLGVIKKDYHMQVHAGLCIITKERFQFYTELGYHLPMNEMDQYRGYLWNTAISFKIRKNSRVGKIQY